ncbi:MAG: hypothetical protein IJL30_06365 [Clostridia bacterium]|nr:hypothetical protein [Clostridia bacterium]
MSELIPQYDEKSLIEALGANSIEIKKWDEIVTSDSIAYSVIDFSSLGTAFSGLSSSIGALSQSAKATGTLYEVTFPVAGKLAAAKDGSGLLGTIINEKGIAGQARFKEVGNIVQTAGGISTFFMAFAIMAINQSLKNISENQKAILGFLEIDKQTQLKGDLSILTEVINEYQYNWNNSQWLSNRETQVLDIKRSAEHNILFYREMIEKKLGTKKQFVSLDASKSLNELQTLFKYYKLALYLYSFSSFMDIMLLKNFDANYLESIKSRIESFANEYNEFYNASIEGVKKIASTSIQSRTIQGLSIAGKFLGNQIAKIPDKNNKIKIDDKLLSGTDKLDGINEKSLNDTKDAFLIVQDSGINLFVDRISLVNKIYNEPLKLYVGAENLYLSTD